MAHERLEYLRGELRAERISTGELAELESLAKFIEPGDVELLEAAGVPEGATRGNCEFCEAQNVLLVGRLASDPDQLVCATCHADSRIPTKPLA